LTATRFTDFQVNEITKDGEIVHLTDFYNNSRELVRATSQSATASPSVQNPSQSNEPMRTAGKDDSAVTSQECAAEEKPHTQTEEPPKDSIAESDRNTLVDLVGQKTAEELILFYAKIQQNPKAAPKAHGDVSIPTIGEKSRRSQVHGVSRPSSIDA
jgi:tRNA pseudouridine13 synthase